MKAIEENEWQEMQDFFPDGSGNTPEEGETPPPPPQEEERDKPEDPEFPNWRVKLWNKLKKEPITGSLFLFYLIKPEKYPMIFTDFIVELASNETDYRPATALHPSAVYRTDCPYPDR